MDDKALVAVCRVNLTPGLFGHNPAYMALWGTLRHAMYMYSLSVYSPQPHSQALTPVILLGPEGTLQTVGPGHLHLIPLHGDRCRDHAVVWVLGGNLLQGCTVEGL